jgi:MoaA/NifB/PqqE/SkfB family radical SAM enzyme
MLRGGRAEVHVSSLITRERIASGELVAFTRGLHPLGVTAVQLFQPRPVGRLQTDREVLLTPEEEERLFAIARELNADPTTPLVVPYPVVEHPSTLGCCGGYSRVYVDARGHVCPCDFTPLSFGTITDEPFTAIWQRMRSFFAAPGSRCLIRDHPEVFGPERAARNVVFAELADPDGLRSPPPGIYQSYRERGYRLLGANPFTATVAACRWKEPSGHG